MRQHSKFLALGLAPVIALSGVVIAGRAAGLAPATPQTQAPTYPVRPMAPQTPPTTQPRGVIVGQVIDAATGRGVSKAAVRLRGKDVAQTRLTDDRGRFYMTNLPAGAFAISAIKTGYFDGAYGRTHAGGEATTLTLADGQWVADATIPLWRPAAVAGYLVDELNEPLVGVRVHALRREFIAGRARLVPEGEDTTDDQGAYRIFGLLPGNYVVSVPTVSFSVPVAAVPDFTRVTAGATQQLAALLRPGSGLLLGGLVGPNDMTYDASGTTMMIRGQSAVPPIDPSGHTWTYPTMFYPGTTLASLAVPVPIAAAEVREGMTLQLSPALTARVSGAVVGPAGPVSGQLLRLVPQGESDLGVGYEAGLTITGPNGAFAFPQVPAGDYTIEAQNSITAVVPGAMPPTPTQSAAPRAVGGMSVTIDATGSTSLVTISGGPLGGDRGLWGRDTVSVTDQDVDDVLITMQAGSDVGGHLVFSGTAAPPADDGLARVHVSLQPADGRGDPPRGVVDETGHVMIHGVAPGRYFVALDGAPAGWTLQSATSDGRDVSTSPLEIFGDGPHDLAITLGDRATSVTGTVRDSRSFGTGAALVVVFPADDREAVDLGVSPRRIRSARPSASGIFTLSGLPAGDYFIVGIDDAASDGWQDPSTLRALRAVATRMTVRASEQKVQDLRLVVRW